MTDHKHKDNENNADEADELLFDIASQVKEENQKIHTAMKNAKRKDAESEDAEARNEGRDNKRMFIGIAAVIILFAAFFIIARFTGKDAPMTIDEMHQANIQGKLDEMQGYVYNGYSFINLGGVWYSQVQKGNALYDISFNNDPRSVEDIPVEGQLSQRFKTTDNKIYITFDPGVQGVKFITQANAGLSVGLRAGFGYDLEAGCTSNESSLCTSSTVVSCDDKDKAVVYFKESAETKVTLDDNCVTIEGAGQNIVRAKDRLLLRWYGIMN